MMWNWIFHIKALLVVVSLFKGMMMKFLTEFTIILSQHLAAAVKKMYYGKLYAVVLWRGRNLYRLPPS